MSLLRIIDANANRAREALRVMEEAARFVLDDAVLTAALKQLRHDLRDALPPIAESQHHRDTPGDVGTPITTAAEQQRDGVADIAIAAGKRLGEALRALEEYSKASPGSPSGSISPSKPGASRSDASGTLPGTLPGGLPGAVLKRLRYRGYELEQQLNAALAGKRRRRQWRLCLLLTRSLCVLPWERVLAEAVEAGADCVQVREKDAEAGELLAHAQAVVQRCRALQKTKNKTTSGSPRLPTVGHATPHPAITRPAVSVIVNDRPDIALLTGADGVHLGQRDLPAAAVRRLVGSELLIGVSTSNLDQAKAARDAGADYCGVGPMFDTTTKHKPQLAGPAVLRNVAAWNGLPHLAIGGITPDNLAALTQAGVRGVAVCAAVCAAQHPGQVVRAILNTQNPRAQEARRDA